MITQLIIDAYYEYRGYVTPTRLQALLFLLSEVGELVNAYRETVNDDMTIGEITALRMALVTGHLAEEAVSGQELWVRNNDRENAANLADEIGDVLMMLDRFSMAAGVGEPDASLIKKMEKNGFRFK